MAQALLGTRSTTVLTLPAAGPDLGQGVLEKVGPSFAVDGGVFENISILRLIHEDPFQVFKYLRQIGGFQRTQIIVSVCWR